MARTKKKKPVPPFAFRPSPEIAQLVRATAREKGETPSDAIRHALGVYFGLIR